MSRRSLVICSPFAALVAFVASFITSVAWMASVPAAHAQDPDPARDAREEAADSAPSAASAGRTWHVSTYVSGPMGFRVIDYWSKGPWMRANTLVSGHPLTTIVHGERYVVFDAIRGEGLSIRRSPRALAEDATRGRPFGNDLAELIAKGGEKVEDLRFRGEDATVWRLTDDATRRTVWVRRRGGELRAGSRPDRDDRLRELAPGHRDRRELLRGTRPDLASKARLRRLSRERAVGRCRTVPGALSGSASWGRGAVGVARVDCGPGTAIGGWTRHAGPDLVDRHPVTVPAYPGVPSKKISRGIEFRYSTRMMSSLNHLTAHESHGFVWLGAHQPHPGGDLTFSSSECDSDLAFDDTGWAGAHGEPAYPGESSGKAVSIEGRSPGGCPTRGLPGIPATKAVR